MEACFSMPTMLQRTSAPTTPASTAASSWACTTTRIYCRPVCTARTPHRVNCRFFPAPRPPRPRDSARACAAAPSSRPGSLDGRRQPPARAIGRGTDRATAGLGEARLPELALALGVTDRHLRRVFQDEFGMAPVEYAQTQRLLLAKRLLTDTRIAGARGGPREWLREPAPLQRISFARATA